ncbi:guanine deaminase [Zychaea mexicana]|uniref:guanine deaminase n=1 Tax=Zychaea mexicana TaxID=64656 RepID=UPI0022FDF905|nr:guanine deaminase [Zychaea mexicana]KAI9487959.1 guanine deaminase [Zychaea mexicana]
MTYNAFYGTIVHSISLNQLDIVCNGLLVVDNDTGSIVTMEREVEDVVKVLERLDRPYKLHRLTPQQFLFPGFVDTHAHAPQYVFAGSGMDLQLLEWLNTYVFPAESSFKSPAVAKDAYNKVVSRFLRNGTTTCSWFATIHLDACKLLVDTIEQLGQRAYVGKVNMDQNSPDYYIEPTEASLNDTREFIEYTQSKKTIITPVVTPRFAITCSSALMHGLGKLAQEHDVPIQTHLCENPNEIDFTCSLFPESKDYTSIYADHGLLGEKSYMAHCVYMTDDEIDMLAKHNTGVSHCANSNFSLHSGVCDVRRFLNKGIKVGLGTDVAGGFAPSMLDAVRSSFFASKCTLMAHRDRKQDYEHLGTAELVYLATLGGARVLGLHDTTGNFVVGKAFDALVVDLDSQGPVDLMGNETPLQMVEKFLFNGSDQSLAHVFVQGRRVAGSMSSP